MSTATATAPTTPATAVPPPVSSRAIAAASRPTELTTFTCELSTRSEEIERNLPKGVSLQKFTDTAIAAVRTNPDLLNTAKCNRLSLFTAIIAAAKDGMMPDGKQGAIVPYMGVATWLPMLFGIRKRMLELGGLIIEAQVVHENDEFEYELGDSPFIRHRPPDVRKRKPKGELCAAYVIVRKDDQIVHREVMDSEDIAPIKKMVLSKLKPGKINLMWTRFESEAWKKTAVHRMAKTMPLVPELAAIFDRENEAIDWTTEETPAIEEQPCANPLRDPELSDDDEGQTPADCTTGDAVVTDAECQAVDQEPQKDAADDFAAELEKCKAIDECWIARERWRPKMTTNELRTKALKAWELRTAVIEERKQAEQRAAEDAAWAEKEEFEHAH